MEWNLNKAIQVEPDADSAADGTTGQGGKLLGHDSAEDARAAGDLVRFKIQHTWARMKREGWTLKNGEFVPPKDSKGKKSGGEKLTKVRKTRDGTEEGELVEV